MYTLYGVPFSQHSRRVVSLLEEAELPYEQHTINLVIGEHMSPGYLALNPNHQVPTLLDGDFKLHESNAILRYLCAKHHLTDWYPEDPKTRGAVDQWLDWNQCRLSPSVIGIVLNKVFLGENGDRSAIAKGELSMVELSQILEAGLEGRSFLASDHPTIADLSVASNMFQLGFANAMPTTPNINGWYGRISALPGFQKSLPQEG